LRGLVSDFGMKEFALEGERSGRLALGLGLGSLGVGA
jgi:hypothetical protein